MIPRAPGPLATLSPTVRTTSPSRPRAATSGIGIGWQKQLEVANVNEQQGPLTKGGSVAGCRVLSPLLDPASACQFLDGLS